ncbi:MAG: hypothetical protein R3D56_13175 [Paracoccaceae bacterium]
MPRKLGGGRQVVVDGFAAARLRAESPALFDALTPAIARASNGGQAGVRLTSRRPMIELA